MNVRRIFANAIARRVAYVLVALVLAWVGIGDARAANCRLVGDACTITEALTECEAQVQWFYTQPSWASLPHRCDHRASVQRFYVQYNQGGWKDHTSQVFRYVTGCPAGYVWDDESKSCGLPCSGLSPIPSSEAHAPGSSIGFCKEGCAYECSFVVEMTIDGQLRSVCGSSAWEPTGSQCSVSDPNPLPDPLPPVTDTDGDGTSDENDLSPNNPGESGDGSGQDVSRACGGPGQPECAPDGSNEGSGRGNTSGGGGDCNTPPRSSGDAILAQIAFQTWATRCAVIATANQGPGTGSGTGDGSEMDKLRSEAAGLDTSLGEGDADAAWIEGPTTLDLDTGGLGIGGTCPAPPTVNGVSIDPDGNLCMLVQIIGTLVLVGAFAHAGYIIGRA